MFIRSGSRGVLVPRPHIRPYLYAGGLQDSFVGIAAAQLLPRASTTSKNRLALPTFSGVTHISIIASAVTTQINRDFINSDRLVINSAWKISKVDYNELKSQTISSYVASFHSNYVVSLIIWQELGIDIVDGDNKIITHQKVAARVICIFPEHDALVISRAG